VTRLVVDASVAIKWYLDEPQAPAARRLLEGSATLLVPGLFFAEMGNAVWKRWRRGELAAEIVRETLLALDLIPFDVHPTRGLLAQASEIAIAHGRTVYDSIYLALAVEAGVRLVTADRKLHEAIVVGDLHDRIVWVEDAVSA
jgi:predicted nucleic acid-binding protein